MTCETNRLSLKIDPIPQQPLHVRAVRDPEGIGASGADLPETDRCWAREFRRARHAPDFARLTRTCFRLWNEFQGLYLLASRDGSSTGATSEACASWRWLISRSGSRSSTSGPILSTNYASRCFRDWALGLYRWPTVWGITWNGSRSPALMTLHLSDRKTIANWVIGGSMGIVQGELVDAGRKWPLYGLAERIMSQAPAT